MLIGIPLALGAWWGLAFLALTIPVLAWRILDEEKLLEKDLGGIRTTSTRYAIALCRCSGKAHHDRLRMVCRHNSDKSFSICHLRCPRPLAVQGVTPSLSEGIRLFNLRFGVGNHTIPARYCSEALFR